MLKNGPGRRWETDRAHPTTCAVIIARDFRLVDVDRWVRPLKSLAGVARTCHPTGDRVALVFPRDDIQL